MFAIYSRFNQSIYEMLLSQSEISTTSVIHLFDHQAPSKYVGTYKMRSLTYEIRFVVLRLTISIRINLQNDPYLYLKFEQKLIFRHPSYDKSV